ncbi:hypothetical protein JL722_7933 [Aureococcus anophagefferens]|nr:hypothetical protein JL722_7933 [Aureococcus anophagefferens]
MRVRLPWVVAAAVARGLEVHMGDGGIVYYGGGDDDAAARDFCAAHRVVDGSCAAELRRMSRELDAPEVDALDAPAGAFGGACPNASYTLPGTAASPGASALASFGRKLGALARNASALEIGGPTTAMGGLYAQEWASVDVVNWSDQAVRKIQGNRPGGYFVVSVPWAEQTYDRRVPVSTIYDLILARGRRGLGATGTWDLALLQEAMACIGAAVEYLDIVDNWHQLVIARVPD